jgi:hypothetical protein
MTLTFDAPQAASITFLIQVKRLIQEEGSAVTPSTSEYWWERLVQWASQKKGYCLFSISM